MLKIIKISTDARFFDHRDNAFLYPTLKQGELSLEKLVCG